MSVGRAAASGSTPRAREHLTDPIDGEVRAKIAAAVTALKADFSRDAAKLATRQSSQKVLEKLLPVVPGLIGGSADLTGSNGTLTKLHTIVKPATSPATTSITACASTAWRRP